MSISNVREYFKQFGKEDSILEFEQSSATVELAAEAAGVIPARIAKTDNKKYKAEFNCKAKMLTPEEVLEFTGHAIGGVCPFGLKNSIKVYLDDSMKRFDTVFPACGSSNSAIELTCEEMEKFSKCEKWVDVCKNW